jgi:hypothetical protein
MHSPNKNNKKAIPKDGLVQTNSSKERESVFLFFKDLILPHGSAAWFDFE